MTRYLKHFLASLTLIAVVGVAWAAAKTLHVEEPWVREGPPTAKALAGYMVLNNAGKADRVLVSASCPAFASVQLHRTITENGVAKMIHQPFILVPANGSVTFEPNSYHLMLMGPKQPLRAGDKVEITLEFKDGTTMPVSFDVRNAGATMNHGAMNHEVAMEHETMDHSSMSH